MHCGAHDKDMQGHTGEKKSKPIIVVMWDIVGGTKKVHSKTNMPNSSLIVITNSGGWVYKPEDDTEDQNIKERGKM